jgi:demethylmenaquinone methyltransferase/2-methoxy-6-polyprenyl-1,4-benzoquinol methylase
MVSQDDKPPMIARMFARIVRAYDLNNRLHSFGRDQAWRRLAAEAAQVAPGDSALDVACGTGDLTAMLARRGAARVVGLDFCRPMLDLARRKFPRRRIEWVLGDAMDLPFAERTFDAVTIAFGLRNLLDRPRALGEFLRVLRPGGRLVVLEFHPPNPTGLLGRAVRFYLEHVMPRTAGAIARDRQGAYEYLTRSIQAFPSPGELTEMIRLAGFADVTARLLTFGAAGIHRGVKPPPDEPRAEASGVSYEPRAEASGVPDEPRAQASGVFYEPRAEASGA